MSIVIASDTISSRDNLTDILSTIYGSQCVGQVARYAEALDIFYETYGSGPAHIFRAPGRINLIGGHTDYNHGYVLPVALDRDLMLIARPRSDRLIRLSNVESEFPTASFEGSHDIPLSKTATWTNYARGAAQTIQQLAPESFKGMDCLVVGKAPYGVPRGSGLSSSTALTVGSAIALARFAELEFELDDFVRYCSDAEWYVGTRGGIMDQFVSLFAKRNHALFLDCRPNGDGSYSVRHVPLPEEYEIIIAESGVHHDNVRGEYNKRVAACRTGVGLLQSELPGATHLRDFENTDWEQIEPLLPPELSVRDSLARGSEIGDIPGLVPNDTLKVRACCRHVWNENQRVQKAYSALQDGDVDQAGLLISKAHESARDDYEISIPEMETLVSTAVPLAGVVGGRITGAGWGGCAVFLVERQTVQVLKQALEIEFKRKHGRIPEVYPCRSGKAAGYIATVTL